jgi:hypothetical protein
MKNNALSKVSRLAVTLTIALPQTLIPSAVAQSEVSRKLLEVAPAIDNGLPSAFGGRHADNSTFTGTALLTTTVALSSAGQTIGNVSTASIGHFDVSGHSDLSNVGSKNPDVQIILKDFTSDFILGRVPAKTVLIAAPSHSGIPSPMTGSPDSVTPTTCSDPVASTENTVLSGARGVCIGGIRIEIAGFNDMVVSSTTRVASPLGGSIDVRNNSIVRATLTDVIITADSIKRRDSSSRDVRIGGIVIK